MNCGSKKIQKYGIPLEDSMATRIDFITSEDDRPEKKVIVESLKEGILNVLHFLDDREEKEFGRLKPKGCKNSGIIHVPIYSKYTLNDPC